MGEIFDGTWTLDIGASAVWDDETRKHVHDDVGQEIITIRTDGAVQDYEVIYGDRPCIRMGYTARFDDPAWSQYEVREITGSGADTEAQLADFKRRIKASEGERERHFVKGQSYGVVRLVYVDDLTHYRVSKSPQDGKAQSMMLRRMAPDGQSYVATVIDLHGIPYRIRKFLRSDPPARTGISPL